MGQDNIGQLLKKYYPEYLSADEIKDLLGVSIQSVYRALKVMSLRDEVEYVFEESKLPFRPWIKKYRVIKEEKQEE